MHKRFFGGMAAALAVLAFPAAALAAGTLQKGEGEVTKAIDAMKRVPAENGMRVRERETISTGEGAHVELLLDDGTIVALDQNTTLRLAAYEYRVAGSARYRDEALLEITRGAVRVVTGAMPARSPEAFQLRAPHATLTASGPSDFTTVLVNPMYVSVARGRVLAANQAGVTPLGAGANVEILSATGTPLNILPQSLPPAAKSAVQKLQYAANTPGGTAQGAAVATSSAGGVGFGTLGAGVAAAAAAIAAMSGGGGDGSTSHSTPSHH